MRTVQGSFCSERSRARTNFFNSSRPCSAALATHVVLYVVPHLLIGIEFRRVGRQKEQMQLPFEAVHVIPDWPCSGLFPVIVRYSQLICWGCILRIRISSQGLVIKGSGVSAYHAPLYSMYTYLWPD